MRTFLLAFVLPMSIFWTWYLLSANDMSFGIFMLTRDMHDFVFKVYGDMLGIEPSTIPPMLVRACITDTFIVLGIWAFRRRREILAWWNRRQAARREASVIRHLDRVAAQVGPIHPAE